MISNVVRYAGQRSAIRLESALSMGLLLLEGMLPLYGYVAVFGKTTFFKHGSCSEEVSNVVGIPLVLWNAGV